MIFIYVQISPIDQVYPLQLDSPVLEISKLSQAPNQREVEPLPFTFLCKIQLSQKVS